MQAQSDRIQRSGHRSARACLFVAAALIAGCAGAPDRAPAHEADEVSLGAIGLIGTPYHWGGNTPQTGFDCSGFVNWVFRRMAGISLPRTSRAMSRIDAPRVKLDELEPGDLVFFRGHGDKVTHVGIYVGNRRFVHAPNSGGEVRLDRLDNSYWSSHFLFGRRALLEAGAGAD